MGVTVNYTDAFHEKIQNYKNNYKATLKETST